MSNNKLRLFVKHLVFGDHIQCDVNCINSLHFRDIWYGKILDTQLKNEKPHNWYRINVKTNKAIFTDGSVIRRNQHTTIDKH